MQQRSSLGARVVWIGVAFFALAIAGYAWAYALTSGRMYQPQLVDSFTARPWGIKPHALFGGIGLVTGALQFHRSLRRRLALHRILGRVYAIACLITGTAGLYMAFCSYGGVITHFGFGFLGALLLITTITAWIYIRRGDVEQHREWMIRSYALMFAAVTLRLELPLLIIGFRDFTTGYRIVAWLCWVPNVLLAEVLVRKTRTRLSPLRNSGARALA